MTTPQTSPNVARTRAFIECCRARGMSPTGIRRALGLSEAEATLWGVVPVQPTWKRRKNVPTFEEIAASAAEHSGAFIDEMCGPRSDYPTALARRVAIYLMRQHIPDADRYAIAAFFDCAYSLISNNERRVRDALQNPESPASILVHKVERELGLK